MRTIRPVKRHVLSTEEAMAEAVPQLRVVPAFYMEKDGVVFKLHNVPHAGDLYDISLVNEPMESGKAFRPDRWARITRDLEYRLISVPLYTAAVIAMHDHPENDHVAELQGLLRDEKQILTSSRVRVAMTKEYIEHDSGYDTVDRINLSQKKDRVLTNEFCGVDEEFMEALFGVDRHRVHDVYARLLGKIPHFIQSGARGSVVLTNEEDFGSQIGYLGATQALGWRVRKCEQ
ncbi:hypothetical protein ACFL0V_01405 [Nanoarchaeota archaeon]